VDGIGFVLAEADPFCAVDLDKCVKDGVIEIWASEVIESLNSYTEISPSGTGIRIICKATLGENCHGRRFGSKEIYTAKRFVTMTGQTLRSVPVREAQAEIGNLLASFPSEAPRMENFQNLGEHPEELDEHTLELINNHRSQHKHFNSLWSGDMSSYAGDHSKADYGFLCSLVALGITKPPQLDAALRASGLYREKWERPDYCESTIAKALATTPTASFSPSLSEVSFLPTPVEKKPAEKFSFSVSEILNWKPAPHLIRKHIPLGSLSCLYGESGCGKTFVALDMALSVSCGIPWLGIYDTKRMPVYYCAGEGVSGISGRIRAWSQFHGMTLDNFWIVPRGYNLLSDFDFGFIAGHIQHEGRSPGYIVFDTLNRYFGGNDENATKDMSQFIGNCDRLRNDFKLGILIVHHTGKDSTRGERGNSVLRGACDTMLSVKGGERLTVACEKQKDWEEFKDITLVKNSVVIGKDEKSGDNITSLVLTPHIEPINKLQEVAQTQRDTLSVIHTMFGLKDFHTDELATALNCSPATARSKACRFRGSGFLTRKEKSIYRLADNVPVLLELAS